MKSYVMKRPHPEPGRLYMAANVCGYCSTVFADEIAVPLADYHKEYGERCFFCEMEDKEQD